MPVEISDADLARGIAAGDREAEDELCRRMGPRIRLYGLRHLRSVAATDDLTQHVLMTVIEALRAGRLREADKLAHFVLGTCRMAVIETHRSGQRRERLLEAFGHTLVPVQRWMPSLDRDRLARCVRALRERERSVIVMTFFDERTAAETAGSLGLSEANVRIIRHRAMKQLRVCMGAS